MNTQDAFPPLAQLREGIILATIAHAIWIVSDPILSGLRGWDGPNYDRWDAEGSFGAITFAGDRLAGVFLDMASPRNPALASYAAAERSVFTGMPADLYARAYEQAERVLTLPWTGIESPLVTAAFWSEGDYLTAAEPWPDVVKHGAHLVSIEAMKADEAMVALVENYDLSPPQQALLRSLDSRKRAAPDEPLVMTAEEVSILVADGSEGIGQSRELLGVVGILVP